MKILALQEFYGSFTYFGFISIDDTFNQLTRIINYLKSICSLGYYYHFSERWKTFYDSTENLPPDNPLSISPNYAGHSFLNTFMMVVCVYNQILNRKIHHVPWKAMDLDLLDAIMHQLTAIYEFYGSHSKATQMVSVRNKTIHKILYLVHHTTPYLSRIHRDKILYHNHLNYSVSYNIHPL